MHAGLGRRTRGRDAVRGVGERDGPRRALVAAAEHALAQAARDRAGDVAPGVSIALCRVRPYMTYHVVAITPNDVTYAVTS